MTTRKLSVAPARARRAGAYIRVSAVMGRTGDDFLSPTIQLDTINRAVERDPVPTSLLEVWEDIDRSGRTMARPGLEAAMDAARNGSIDVLYVYDLSRWARNAADGLAELAAIERCGVPVVSATEGSVDRSTATGRLTAGLLLILAEHYSDMVADRWRSALRANAERGVLHGRAPLGYVRVAKRQVEIDPVLGPAVADVFRRFVDGESIGSLARLLGKVRGQSVSESTTRALLGSEVYLGKTRLHGAVYDGRHPALIDDATWHRAQSRLARNSATPPRTLQAVHGLAGLVRCAECGGPAWRRQRNDRPHLGDVYVCRGMRVDGSSSCRGFGTPNVREVEAAVLEWLRRQLVDTPDTSAALAAKEAGRSRARVDVSQLADEIARGEKALGNLAAKLAGDVISDVAYRAAAVQIEESLNRLRSRLAEAEVVVDAPDFTAAQTMAAALVQMWPDMTPQERSAAVATHVRQVRIRRAMSYRQPVHERLEIVAR